MYGLVLLSRSIEDCIEERDEVRVLTFVTVPGLYGTLRRHIKDEIAPFSSLDLYNMGCMYMCAQVPQICG